MSTSAKATKTAVKDTPGTRKSSAGKVNSKSSVLDLVLAHIEASEKRMEVNEKRIAANHEESERRFNKLLQEVNAQSNGAGRITENLMAQGMKKAVEEKFGEKFSWSVDLDGEVAEGRYQIDVLLASPKHMVVVEVKNNPSDQTILQLEQTIRRFQQSNLLAPGRPIVPAVASTRIDKTFFTKAQAAGVLCFEIGPHDLVREATQDTIASQGRSITEPKAARKQTDTNR
jgi:hypothetical protein